MLHAPASSQLQEVSAVITQLCRGANLKRTQIERDQHLGLRPDLDPDCELSTPPPVGPRPHFPQLDPFPNFTSFCWPSSEEQASGRQKTGDPFMVNLAVMSADHLVSLTPVPLPLLMAFSREFAPGVFLFLPASQGRGGEMLKKNVRRVPLRLGRCPRVPCIWFHIITRRGI